ncbi:hypothetical protein K2173_004962 [Erythroxylum novogranatense]|uniref:mitogen-activated protein kinase n=1 Tax=Erythroxylum novogranatense TaxID=1862640 RepID=A0AAV8U8J3_9ROSI|nr:hypothetical protein K2173_004962 [Erythroxylum novogranatense]
MDRTGQQQSDDTEMVEGAARAATKNKDHRILYPPGSIIFRKSHHDGGLYKITYSSALNSETGEHVAIKKIANAFDNKIDAKRTLREIKLVRHMDHENVVAIRDIIPPPQRESFNDVYIAYKLMDTDLHQIIRSNQALSEEHCQETRNINVSDKIPNIDMYLALLSHNE